jgi:hypothetical protein
MSPTSGGHTPHQVFAPLAARQMIGHLHYFIKDTALAVLGDCGY